MNTTNNNLLPEPMIYDSPTMVCFTFEDAVRATLHDEQSVTARFNSEHGWEIVTNSPTGYCNALRFSTEDGILSDWAASEELAWKEAWTYMSRYGYEGWFYKLSDIDAFIEEDREGGNANSAARMIELKAELQAAIDERGKA